jgi:hypothetical protein
MASPVGHALVGVLIHRLSARDRREWTSPARALGIVAAATAADVDLTLRLVDGANHHQAEMHSLGFALIVAAAIFGVLRRLGRAAPLRGALVGGGAWLSHGVVDFLSGDTNPPFGPMLFWPLSHAHFISPWPIFSDTARALTWHAVAHNGLALLRELVILLPILGAVILVRARKDLRASAGGRRS